MKRGTLNTAALAIFAIWVGYAAAPTWAREELPLGSQAPDFQLTDVVSGKTVSLSDFSGKKALLVIFICRHCPYVQHVKQALAQLAKDYEPKGVAVAGVSSNDPAVYPQDAPASLKEMALQEGFIFPVLFDESQSTARAYSAVCTPDSFLFDQDRKLVYHGQLDDTRPGGPPATAQDLRAALDAVLSGRPVSQNQKPPAGCSIKWKKSS